MDGQNRTLIFGALIAVLLYTHVTVYVVCRWLIDSRTAAIFLKPVLNFWSDQVNLKKFLWLFCFFFLSQHVVVSVAEALLLHQDLNAPLATPWCTLSWSWPQGLPQTTALSRSSPSLSWLTSPCPASAEASCKRYKPGTQCAQHRGQQTLEDINMRLRDDLFNQNSKWRILFWAMFFPE